ncbi:MAG TPA: hypothetical protein VK524_21325, partial [Polyangiaceae bacterium]|nr:hypothetical protein [Polyangiaceae bacterium]
VAHPVQLSLALRALHTLPALTVAAYDAVGRLDGLVGTLITEKARAAATAGNLSVEATLAALRQLIDEDGARTREVLESELIGDDAGLRAAFTALEQEELVKCRGDGDERRWMLFHDFFAPAITEAIRRRDALAEEFRRRYREFETATGILDAWRALLPPMLQFRIWRNEPARKGYVKAPRYASLSALRFAPYLLAGAALHGVSSWIHADFRAWQLLMACPPGRDSRLGVSIVCREAFQEASPEERFRAFEMGWPTDTSIADGVYGRQPWPPALPEASDFIERTLMPCARREVVQRFIWSFEHDFPSFRVGRTGTREDCAVAALHLSNSRRKTAVDLLRHSLADDLNLTVEMLSQLDESDVDYGALAERQRRIAAARVPDTPPPPRNSSTRYVRLRRGPHLFRYLPSSQLTWTPSNAEMHTGRDRLIKLVEATKNPLFAMEVWYGIQQVASAAQSDRLKRVLAGLELSAHRGNRWLLLDYAEVLSGAPVPTALKTQLVSLVDEQELRDDDPEKWLWVATLCELGVEEARIRLEFDPSPALETILNQSLYLDGRSMLPESLRVFTRATLCKYQNKVTGLSENIATKLLKSLQTARAARPRPGISNDLNRSIAILWPGLGRDTRDRMVRLALETQHDGAEEEPTAFDEVVAAFSSTATAAEATDLCQVLKGAFAVAYTGEEFAALVSAAKRICPTAPDPDTVAALRRVRYLSGSQLARVLATLTEAERCPNSCFALEQANRQIWRHADLSGWTAVTAICPAPQPCSSAVGFVHRLATTSYVQQARGPSDVLIDAKNLLILSSKVPDVDRRGLVEKLLPESLHALDSRPLPALVRALCKNSVADISAALAPSDFGDDNPQCRAFPDLKLAPATPPHGVGRRWIRRPIRLLSR